jgi:ATP-binding cassette subfamily B protein
MLIEVAMDLMQPRLVQRIIDDGVARNDVDVVRTTALQMLGLSVIGMIGGALCGVFAIRAAQGFGADLRSALFGKVQELSFGNLDRLETGGLITRLTNDVTQLTEMVAMLLRIMVRVPLLFFGSLVLAYITSPRLSLMFLVLIPLVVLVIATVMRLAFPMFRKIQRRLDTLNGVMQENLAGVRVVRAFARSPYERQRFGDANRDLMETTFGAIRYIVVVMPLLWVLINFGIVATLWFGGRLVDSGNLEVGQIVAFISYLLQTLMSIMFFSMLAMRLGRAEASTRRVNEVLADTPDITNPPAPVAGHTIRGAVTFEHVTFAYDVTSEPVLREISFAAQPGQVVAILGATGSGKSSLVSLIPRFYDPQAGRVLIDGMDVREIDEETLRDGIAIALQESVLFSGSLRDNIRYGRPDATDEEIERATEAAQAHEFISELPEGLDSVIGQRGVNLSGGQKQRVAIARALIKGAPILILDDSTSAVDVATEARIQEALARLQQTLFIVAQRISAVVNADTILVLDDGRLVGHGSHEELLATCDVYRDIYESQMERTEAIHGAA